MAQPNHYKTNLTENTYQSQFLPLVENAGMTIKKLVVFYAINNKNLYQLEMEIQAVISELDKKLPIDLIDRGSYLMALNDTSRRLIKKFYKPMIKKCAFYSSILVGYGIIKKPFKSPKALIDYTNKLTKGEISKINDIVDKSVNLWSEAKGTPHIANYGKQVKDALNGMAKTDIAPREVGKKPISIWQKAELDIRHDHQMKMIEDLKAEGVKLCWVSSHPDCSKRCEKWQGKLVNIQDHAEMSGFRMKGKVDGYTVYSLTDIMAQKDKYGYENNIINGFNCRHHLSPYTKGSVAPKEYTNTDIKKEREINATLRRMEREIRHLKQRAELLQFVDTKESKILYNKARKLTEEYKRYANSNGFAWYRYRIQA